MKLDWKYTVRNKKKVNNIETSNNVKHPDVSKMCTNIYSQTRELPDQVETYRLEEIYIEGFDELIVSKWFFVVAV